MQSETDRPALSRRQIEDALGQSAAFLALPADQLNEMTDALSRVFNYLGSATVRPMEPDFGQIRGGSGSTVPAGGSNPYPGGGLTPGAVQPPAPPAPGTPAAGGGAASGGPNAFHRAAGATR